MIREFHTFYTVLHTFTREQTLLGMPFTIPNLLSIQSKPASLVSFVLLVKKSRYGGYHA